MRAAFGGIDVLVNNAGIMKLAPIAKSDDALFDSQIAVNLKGVFNTLREAARSGCATAAASSTCRRAWSVSISPTYGIYAATKAAVEAMTHVLSKELRGRNITVNAVAPGPTGDGTVHRRQAEGGDRQLRASSLPLERLGTPEDIASAISFLAGPDGTWINGQVLRANGGTI